MSNFIRFCKKIIMHKLVALVIISIDCKLILSKEFKCKPRPGCCLWSCNPTPDLSADIIDRNEFPILCEDGIEWSLNGSINVGANHTELNNTEDAEKVFTRDMINEIIRQSVEKVYTLHGWVKSGDYIFRKFSDPVIFRDARKKCQGFRGRLAAEVVRHPYAVRYIIENKFVLLDDKRSSMWIGTGDAPKEGEWVWTDLGTMNENTMEWRIGEPNSLLGEEDCGVVVGARNEKLLLNDASCYAKYPFLCEINLDNII